MRLPAPSDLLKVTTERCLLAVVRRISPSRPGAHRSAGTNPFSSPAAPAHFPEGTSARLCALIPRPDSRSAQIKGPSPFFRLLVLGAQGVFVNMFFFSYLISPKSCHRFVGYLEEEAVHTYTQLVKALERNEVPEWAPGGT